MGEVLSSFGDGTGVGPPGWYLGASCTVQPRRWGTRGDVVGDKRRRIDSISPWPLSIGLCSRRNSPVKTIHIIIHTVRRYTLSTITQGALGTLSPPLMGAGSCTVVPGIAFPSLLSFLYPVTFATNEKTLAVASPCPRFPSFQLFSTVDMSE